MNILINALAVKIGGGLTYITNFVSKIGLIDRDNQYTIITSKGLNFDLPPNINQIRVNVNSVLHRIFYEQFILPFYIKRLKIDLLYSPHDITTLLAPCRVVLAMRNPCLYTTLEQKWGLKDALRIKILSRMARLSALKADRILFASDDSKDRISQKLRLDQSKLRVVHHGVNTMDRSNNNNIDSKYILSVSTIYHYKNYIRLIEAYAALLKKIDIKEDLMIIGKAVDRSYYRKMQERITSLGLQERIKLIGDVPYHEIFSYYQNARLFVFPSYLETFGHPILEAMATGVPVATSDIGVFHEIGEDAVQYFDPLDVANMAEVIGSCLNSQNLRKGMIEKGLIRVKEFTWEKTVTKTLEIFNELCG